MARRLTLLISARSIFRNEHSGPLVSGNEQMISFQRSGKFLLRFSFPCSEYELGTRNYVFERIGFLSRSPPDQFAGADERAQCNALVLQPGVYSSHDFFFSLLATSLHKIEDFE